MTATRPSGEAGGPADRPRPLVIYGAGGHGQAVAEAARLSGVFDVLGFLDDAPTAETVGLSILTADDARLKNAWFHVAIGDNATRQKVAERVTREDRTLATVVHPTAFVSPTAALSLGVFIGPGAVVHTGAHVGDGAIVNSGAVVEHHNRIGAFAHVAPGAVLGGGVSIGERTLVGLGSRVLQGTAIGKDVTVGAGAVVLKAVPDGARVVGVPARP